MDNFFKRVKRLSPQRKFSLFAIAAILLALPLTLVVLSQRQDVRQRASVPQTLTRLTYDESLQRGLIKQATKIVQINLSYNENTVPILVFNSIEVKNGYVPQTTPDSGYKLDILDTTSKVIYTQYFTIPNQIEVPPPLPGESATVPASNNKLTRVSFSLNAPYYSNAVLLRISDTRNQLLTTMRIPKTVPNSNNKPNFHTVPGTEFIKQNKQGFLYKLQDLFSHPVFAANNDGHFDIAIIADNYTDMNAFHADADAIMSYVLSYYEPMHTRASQITAHYIDNTANLGCAYSAQSARNLLCNNQLVVSQVNNAAAPYDAIYVLSNRSDYGGDGNYPVSVGYNGPSKGPMFAHEFFGHNVGRLYDEYVTQGGNGVIDNQTHALSDTDGNCYAGSPPVAAWSGVITPQDYTLSCNYANWYRSSAASVMLYLTSEYFNPVSQAILNRRLDHVAGVFTGPTPTPTSTPTPIPVPTNPVHNLPNQRPFGPTVNAVPNPLPNQRPAGPTVSGVPNSLPQPR